MYCSNGCGKARKDGIKNEHIQEHLGIVTIGDKLRDLFEMVWTFVQWMLATAPMRSFSMQVRYPSKKRARSKRIWMKVTRIDLTKCNLLEDLTRDRSKWRNKIHIANLNTIGTSLWWWWWWIVLFSNVYQINNPTLF